MSDVPRFEHIAIAVPAAELFAWDRLLRGELGGSASLGGAEPRSGFQGGQITYPGGGMLEVLSWLPEAEDGAMKRFVEKHGGQATLHHLTFLVDDLDEALERARSLGYEPMVGRRSANWEEFFVRDTGLRPAGMLIQVLRADKDALRTTGWDDRWEPFTVDHEDRGAPATIGGVTLATTDPGETARLFSGLLEADEAADGNDVILAWAGSSMQVRLVASETSDDSFVAITGSAPTAARQAPKGATSLLRAAALAPWRGR